MMGKLGLLSYLPSSYLTLSMKGVKYKTGLIYFFCHVFILVYQQILEFLNQYNVKQNKFLAGSVSVFNYSTAGCLIGYGQRTELVVKVIRYAVEIVSKYSSYPQHKPQIFACRPAKFHKLKAAFHRKCTGKNDIIL